MAWAFILLADVFEIAWPYAMKWASGISKFMPMVVSIALVLPVSFFLSFALKSLPAGTTYAAFIGIGAVGVAIVGMIFFNESTALPRVCSLVLVIVGLIGLKFYS
jgi:quaternary ammonium compound-resistance protein SugE